MAAAQLARVQLPQLGRQLEAGTVEVLGGEVGGEVEAEVGEEAGHRLNPGEQQLNADKVRGQLKYITIIINY